MSKKASLLSSSMEADVVTHTSFCRLCHNSCPVVITTRRNKMLAIHGDRANPYFEGYTCDKGRRQFVLYDESRRLLRTLKRQPNGEYTPLPVVDAIGEIADRLRVVIDRHGPRAVALYGGGYLNLSNPASALVADAFFNAIGSPMRFTPITIDQPGKLIAKGFLGQWSAPAQKWADTDVLMIVGGNPLVSYQGMPMGHPGKFLKEFSARGGRLIIVDPRRTETAKRADLHLQPRPGEDIAIVAGMLRLILDEGLYDVEFVDENVVGLDGLRRYVQPFDPTAVASRAGIDADDLVRAARMFAGGSRGFANAGTGPNMAGQGTLLEYLLLCLDTVCGHVMRAGEVVKAVPTFLRTEYRAQAIPPFPTFGYGEKLRVKGLTDTVAGLPTAAAADEILLEGEGRVRALLSFGGNPVVSWPDQLHTIEAMRDLELLVQGDVVKSATAGLAHYVIATKRAFEMPAFSWIGDMATMYPTYGYLEAHAQYTTAVVGPPPGAELIEDWEFFYDLARSMGLQLRMAADPLQRGEGSPLPPVALDMQRKPTTDELFGIMAADSRVPLEVVKRHPHGALFPDPTVIVQPKEPGWEGRLDIGNATMMSELAAFGLYREADDPAYPFRLVSRRIPGVFNSAAAVPTRRRLHNPAYINPADLAERGLTSGDHVEICSARAVIPAVVEADESVRRGTISMSHGHGDVPVRDHEFLTIGSNTSRLIDNDVVFDRYSGMPRMSNIPVDLRPVTG